MFLMPTTASSVCADNLEKELKKLGKTVEKLSRNIRKKLENFNDYVN